MEEVGGNRTSKKKYKKGVKKGGGGFKTWRGKNDSDFLVNKVQGNENSHPRTYRYKKKKTTQNLNPTETKKGQNARKRGEHELN